MSHTGLLTCMFSCSCCGAFIALLVPEELTSSGETSLLCSTLHVFVYCVGESSHIYMVLKHIVNMFNPQLLTPSVRKLVMLV